MSGRECRKCRWQGRENEGGRGAGGAGEGGVWLH